MWPFWRVALVCGQMPVLFRSSMGRIFFFPEKVKPFFWTERENFSLPPFSLFKEIPNHKPEEPDTQLDVNQDEEGGRERGEVTAYEVEARQEVEQEASLLR